MSVKFFQILPTKQNMMIISRFAQDFNQLKNSHESDELQKKRITRTTIDKFYSLKKEIYYDLIKI